MDKTQKRRLKKYISWGCIVLVIAFLAIVPLMAKSEPQTDGPTASILSGTVESGTIETAIHSGGTLAAESAEDLTIPSGVMLEEFLVSNGDSVAAGDPLATVDRVSVMTAITQVQETLDYLAEEMADISSDTVSETVTAQAGGRVKAVYAQEGESVQEVMLRSGALAVLSLDGLMAVEIPYDTPIAAGDSVTVTFSDETQVTGRVESALDGIAVITIEDDGYSEGEEVQVSSEETLIGSGSLYIHSAWKAVAYSGTVEDVRIEAEDTVSAGKTIFTLEDTGASGEFASLSAQHRQYEEVMLELFQLYQNTVLTAPCDGTVSGVDEDSVHLLSDDGEEWVLELLVNSPDGNDEVTYSNFVGMVTGLDGSMWNLALNPANLSITDYTVLSGVPMDTTSMTQVASFLPSVPIYELVDGVWQQIDAAAVTPGDILLFAGDEASNFVWVVRLGRSEVAPTEPSEPSEPSTPTEPSVPSTDPTAPSEPAADATTPTQPTAPSEGTQTTPSVQTPSSGSSGFSGSFSGSISGSVSSGISGSIGGSIGGSVQEESEFELYDLTESTIMTVTSRDAMILTVTLDEKDIAKVQIGQSAQVKVDALKGETFSAAITKIGTSGTSNGGSSKFTVELTLDAAENMLAGMNATVSIPLSRSEDVLTIPVAALVEDGTQTIVYTGYDEETGTLCDPVTVTTGVSDGETVQILSGLEQNDTYYYAYYDTLELSTAVESAGFSFGG